MSDISGRLASTSTPAACHKDRSVFLLQIEPLNKSRWPMHRDKPLTPCSPLNTPQPVKASSLLFRGLEFNAHWSLLPTVTASPN